MLKGSWLTAKRVLKCHPLHAGGDDPVPPKKTMIIENYNDGFATQSSTHRFAIRFVLSMASLGKR
ncbi:hypothetical protein OO7_01686 [Providencia sneebia DSM 19967]|uniref:Membrane protein insertion efficiency factor n=1 Tax=Providencia sneebia DSM 19967 TaxID=1141660 RepID=K8WN41_9GAMM|nr:hypothetical protein OO7_01686 [Providencia sneebia DSM 19967]